MLFNYRSLDKDMPMSQVMQSARMGEAAAQKMIKDLGIEAVLNSYIYKTCKPIRHLWYFRTFVDVIDTYAARV